MLGIRKRGKENLERAGAKDRSRSGGEAEDDFAALVGGPCEHLVCDLDLLKRKYGADLRNKLVTVEEVCERVEPVGGDFDQKEHGMDAERFFGFGDGRNDGNENAAGLDERDGAGTDFAADEIEDDVDGRNFLFETSGVVIKDTVGTKLADVLGVVGRGRGNDV